jgi:hypothetical protein
MGWGGVKIILPENEIDEEEDEGVKEENTKQKTNK